MRIGLLADQFPALTETFVSAEAQELVRQGHRVHVVAGGRPRDADPGAAAGLDVAYAEDDTRAGRLRALAWLVARHPLRSLRDTRSRSRWAREEHVRRLRELAPAARRLRARDVEHLHAHFAAGAALDALRLGALLDLPYSVMTHGYDIFATPANLREKHARAAFAVTASTYSAEHLRRLLGDAIGARVHRLVAGVDAQRFARTAPYPGGRTVIAVARLAEKKGLVHLVDAVALLRDRGRPLDAVRIVGDGPLQAALAARIAEHGLEASVELLGARSPEQIREELERSDVLAMPSVIAADGDRDTMPVVVKEALAMEIPVVASDAFGLPEMIQPGWGILAPPGDAEALANALDEVLTRTPGERARMGSAGRAFVLEHCSLQAETARLVERIRAAS